MGLTPQDLGVGVSGTKSGRAQGGSGAEKKAVSIEMSSNRCVQGRSGGWGFRSLVLLQLSPDDKHPVGVRPRRHLLHVADGLEPLWAVALRHDDIDFETVTDLRRRGDGH